MEKTVKVALINPPGAGFDVASPYVAGVWAVTPWCPVAGTRAMQLLEEKYTVTHVPTGRSLSSVLGRMDQGEAEDTASKLFEYFPDAGADLPFGGEMDAELCNSISYHLHIWGE
jgi:hypothetical protein